MPRHDGVRRRSATILLVVALLAGALLAPGPARATAEPPTALYLVTLEGPGVAGYRGPLPATLVRPQLHREQDLVLERVGSPEPGYRWLTALNGFAVRLTELQAEILRADPRVSLVEQNRVRPLAGTSLASAGPSLGGRPGTGSRGGAGVVIGFVDTGIWPGSPLFADVPGLGRPPQGFHGACIEGEDWDQGTCNRKLVAARWFVDGFGADRIRASASLSPRDDDGHGTQLASIAAGNAGVSVRVDGQRLGGYSGMAPQARIAVYKACWTAPDPQDDGCATADLVTAVDLATRDGVDVLNVAVGGPGSFDTVERALLGAAEAGAVVVAAAGNGTSFAAHPGPWVTTVGATTGVVRRGSVRLEGGPALAGAMASERGTPPARLVVGARVAAPGAERGAARVCTPGSLDAARVAGAVVLCERGAIGRVDKSVAVARADGIGMVLANVGPGATQADFHSVPTVHLNRSGARVLRHWLSRYPDGRVSLRPQGVERSPVRVPHWSQGGDPAAPVLKPDVVSSGAGTLGAVPPSVRPTRWDLVSGTSAATARTSGVAALLLSRHGWSASAVRSALVTTAAPVPGPTLAQGGGRVRPRAARTPGLVLTTPSSDYRAWLEGSRRALNTPSVLLSGEESTVRRRITNVGPRTMYFSSSAHGFARHRVSVTPAAVRLAPGESAWFRFRVLGPSAVGPIDDGWVSWRGADGTRTRIAVVLAR